VEIAEAIFPVLAILTLSIATAVLSRMVKINPIVGYLFLGMVVSAVRPELVASWADRR
jgi:CPA2 family monovalent cation:H+ antiporter-2